MRQRLYWKSTFDIPMVPWPSLPVRGMMVLLFAEKPTVSRPGRVWFTVHRRISTWSSKTLWLDIYPFSGEALFVLITPFLRQAKALQSGLIALLDRVDKVKEEHDKLEAENRFLQEYASLF